jgi:penicillin-binding protein 1A
VKQELLEDDSQTMERKVLEATMAVQLERQYSKDRILELYLNAIYFGNGAYGVEAAAHQYFGKTVADLSIAEGALIAGLIQRPGATDPFDEPQLAFERRQVVLERMHENHLIDDAELLWAKSSPVTLASDVVPAAERYPAAYFVEEVKQWILDDPRFGETAKERRDLLFGGGLRIHTTVDLAMQARAEEAVGAFLPSPTGPAASLVSIEAATGYVRAMVGGRDFFGTGPIAKLNLATQGPRQTGSAFKPLVLATALAEGIDPETRIPAPACVTIPLENAPPWKPCNYGGGSGGTVSIVEGTVRSYNTLYAQLMMRVGPKAATDAATRYGIVSPLEAVPAAVLGSNSVTAMDMAGAYSTFANRGIRVPPVLVTRITRADGTVLFNHEHRQTKVLEANVADTLTSILQQVIERGTGTKAKLDRPAAGKTGTADDWVDAWFAGYTPELATAVWVGFPELGPDGKLVQMRPPSTPLRVTGGSYPAEIWQRFMSTALAGRPVVPFHPPSTTTTTPPSTVAGPPTTRATGAPTEVPDVVGKKADDAAEILREAGFRVDWASTSDFHPPPGRVEAQSPPPGTTAPRGSTVTIEIGH